MTDPRRATRRDVARLAGVSDAVVSYTINGGAPVAPATAGRVRAAIAELGYQPNAAARALRSGSSRTIALLAPVGARRLFANPFFAELASAVEDAARARGLDLLLTTSTPNEAALRERMHDLAARQVDGVLLLAGDPIDEQAIDAIGVPWLLLNSTDRSDLDRSDIDRSDIDRSGIDRSDTNRSDPATDGVDSDRPDRDDAGGGSGAQAARSGIGVNLAAGAATATGHLAALGRRRIAFLGETGRDMHGRLEPRRRGWEQACREAGLEPGPAINTPYSREGGLASGRLLAALPEQPDAVVTGSDLIAIGLLRALREVGLRVPEDVAVVGFDGTWEGEYSSPPLTSLRQPLERMAEAALARLRGDPAGTELFAGELVVRGSCGAALTPTTVDDARDGHLRW